MKFSIRDLLLFTLIVALVVGWWMDHQRQAIQVKTFVKLQKEAAAKIRLFNLMAIPAAAMPINTPDAIPPASKYPPGDYPRPRR